MRPSHHRRHRAGPSGRRHGAAGLGPGAVRAGLALDARGRNYAVVSKRAGVSAIVARRFERRDRAFRPRAAGTAERFVMVSVSPAATDTPEPPSRVVRALEEFFCGYGEDPDEILQKSFDEIEGYDELVILRGVRFESNWNITSPRSSGRPPSLTFLAGGWSASANWRAWCRH